MPFCFVDDLTLEIRLKKPFSPFLAVDLVKESTQSSVTGRENRSVLGISSELAPPKYNVF